MRIDKARAGFFGLTYFGVSAEFKSGLRAAEVGSKYVAITWLMTLKDIASNHSQWWSCKYIVGIHVGFRS